MIRRVIANFRDSGGWAIGTIRKVVFSAIEISKRLLRPWTSRIPPARRQLLARIGVGAFVAYLALAVITGLGIYLLRWQNPLSAAMSLLVPYPAAYVDGQTIHYSAYVREAGYLKASNRQAAKAGGSQELGQAEINRQAMGELINATLIARWADERNIKVDQAAVDQQVKLILDGQGGEQAALKVLRQEYGMSRGQFAARVERQLLQLKVGEAIASDTAYLRTAREKAEQLLERLKKGADFVAVARTDSAHSSAHAEGEAALVAISTLPRNVAAAAVAMRDGQLASRPVEASGTFYLIRRERATERDVLVRIITVPSITLSQWLAEELSRSAVNRLLPQTRSQAADSSEQR